VNTANFSCCKINLINLVFREKLLNCALVNQIQFIFRCSQYVDVASFNQLSYDRCAHHTPMTSNKYFLIEILHYF